MLRVVAVLRHRDVDVERALDEVQLRRPQVGVRRRRTVNSHTTIGPLREVVGLGDLDVAAGGVEKIVRVAMPEDPRIRALTALDRYGDDNSQWLCSGPGRICRP